MDAQDWINIAGGDCRPDTWRVGLLACNRQQQAFLLTDAQWQRLQADLPLRELNAYASAHGLHFDRLLETGASAFDAVLLVEDEAQPEQAPFTLPSALRRYVWLGDCSGLDEWLTRADLARVFAPVEQPFRSERLLALQRPCVMPGQPQTVRELLPGAVRIHGVDALDNPLSAHFALCRESQPAASVPSSAWQWCWRHGVVPVLQAGEVAAWIAPGSYVDARAWSSADDMLAHLRGMDASRYRHLCEQINDFFCAEQSYPYSVDCWISTLTAGIAGDARQVRNRQALVTVIIPTYNYGRFLEQALRSVLDQQLQGVEVLVLDNASTDNTAQLMQAYAGHPQVRYIRNRRNIGPSFNVINGFRMACGRYLTVLMADDFQHPGFLSRAVTLLEQRPEVALVYTSCRWVDEDGRELGVLNHPGHARSDYVGGRNEVAGLLEHDNYITPSATLYRRSALLEAWQFDPQLHGAGDWNCVLQLAGRYPDFAFFKSPGVSYRQHGTQHSQQFYRGSQPLQDHLRVLEGVFERQQLHLLGEQAASIKAHLLRRLQQYPAAESALQARARELCARLDELRDLAGTPLFSIILTTFNRPQLLKDALDSLATQTLQDFEVILVNDHGCPVESLLENYAFALTYIRQGRNQGLSAARNAGLRLARGRFIAYLDDDDLYLPGHLETLAKAFAEHPDSVIYTAAEYVNERLEEGGRVEVSRHMPFAHQAYSKDRLFTQNYIPVNTWSHPRYMLEQVGEFDRGLAAFEDWDMLLRLAERYPFVYVAEVTAEVHQREASNQDHMLARQRNTFPALYRQFYERYQGSASDALRQARQRVLAHLHDSPEQRLPSFTLEDWLAARLPTATENRLINEYLASHAGGPALQIIVLDPQGQTAALMQTLKSLSSEHCLYATLSIVVLTVSAIPCTAATDKLHFLAIQPQDWVQVLNQWLTESRADWFMLARAGDEFTPSGLMIAGLELAANPDCRAIYGDQLQRLGDGSLGGAFLPDFNLDFFLSVPVLMGRYWLFRRELVVQGGGFAADYAEAIEFELLTRLIEEGGLTGLGHIDEALLITAAPALRDNPDERRVIERHLARRGYQARLREGLAGRYQLDYQHPQQPLVSIVIRADAPLAHLQRCIDSLLEQTRYAHYEVLLIEGDALPAATREWLCGVAALDDERMRYLPVRTINEAIDQLRGEYLLLLSAEAAVIQGDWLDELLNHAQRPEVGVVGGKLLNAAGRVQHAGLILGLRGVAARAFAGEALESTGYLQRLQVDQNYSAVSEACLLVRTQIFRQLGGLDEGLSAFRDVDFCLRVHQAGYLVVWAARALLLHEGNWPTPTAAEQERLYERYLPQLAHDPAYNRNLSLNGHGFQIESDSGLTWRPLTWRPLPVTLVHPADLYGCGHYRVLKPFAALKEAGLIDGMASCGLLQVADLQRCAPDVIILQRQIGDERLEAMRRIQKFSQAFTVYELDDYLPNLPLKSVHRGQMPKDVLKSLRRGLQCVDRFVVSTEALAEAFAGLHGDIRVVNNYLPVNWWGELAAQRRQGRKPRVGWAGGAGHTGDLELIADVVKALADEVEWVFMGMCPAKLRPYVHEVHDGVAIDAYPAALAALNLDLALAPLEQNLFNECKSNLRLLEYGACGFAVVCSDVRCYQQDGLPVTRVKNRFKDWLDAIRQHISDLDACAAQGDRLYAAVRQNWMLEGNNLQRWKSAWMPD